MISSTSTYIASGTVENPTHAGVERVATGLGAFFAGIERNGTRKTIGSGLIAVGTMAAVTAAERAMDASPTGFTAELIVLGVVAALAYFSLRAIVIPALRAVAQAWRSLEAYDVQSQEEMRFLEIARRDPRIMNDLLAAQGRHEQFVSEASVRTEGRKQSEYAADKLTHVAPWVSLARFH
jgi:hypothetical protein